MEKIGLVINRLRTFLADPGAILDVVDNESHRGSGSQPIERGRQVAEDLGGQAPDELKATLMTLHCRVEVRSDRIDCAELQEPVVPPPSLALRAITLASPDVSRLPPAKSQPRNGAGEIFMTATAEIARETVSARIALERGTSNPRNSRENRLPRKTNTFAL
jgi:hypothetical protein